MFNIFDPKNNPFFSVPMKKDSDKLSSQDIWLQYLTSNNLLAVEMLKLTNSFTGK